MSFAVRSEMYSLLTLYHRQLPNANEKFERSTTVRSVTTVAHSA